MTITANEIASLLISYNADFRNDYQTSLIIANITREIACIFEEFDEMSYEDFLDIAFNRQPKKEQ